MKLKHCVLFILIILFIFMIYFNYNIESTHISKYINGYWTSNNKFAKLSDIDDMILNIDIENLSGFLIIIIDKEIVNNDEFILKINKIQNKKNSIAEFEVEFLSDDDEFIWFDKKFKAILSINEGSLKLFHNDTLYADLFKDNKMTYLLN